jgi:hypothetical protein
MKENDKNLRRTGIERDKKIRTEQVLLFLTVANQQRSRAGTTDFAEKTTRKRPNRISF